jgi:hypothetical protein
MGATADEMARGLAAVRGVFDRHGITRAPADARYNVDVWDINRFKERSHAEDLALCAIWNEADEAAVKACCSGWSKRRTPISANLELLGFLKLSFLDFATSLRQGECSAVVLDRPSNKKKARSFRPGLSLAEHV